MRGIEGSPALAAVEAILDELVAEAALPLDAPALCRHTAEVHGAAEPPQVRRRSCQALPPKRARGPSFPLARSPPWDAWTEPRPDPPRIAGIVAWVSFVHSPESTRSRSTDPLGGLL